MSTMETAPKQTTNNRRTGRRRGNGEGTISRRNDGYWEAKLSVGRRPDGRLDRRSVSGKSRADVQAKLEELKRQKAGGLITEPHRLTVAAYLGQWLDGSVKPSSRDNTYCTYKALVNTHVIPRLGSVLLVKLAPAHLASLYAAMREAGKAPATIRLVHALMHRALVQAVGWNYVARNVADAVDPPAPKAAETHALTTDEARALITTSEAAGDRLAPLWRLLVDTGCRIGELLALTWEHVDLDRGSIAIRRTLIRVARGGRPVTNEPKTGRSKRRISLTPATVAVLRAHRARQLAERLRAGPDYADYGLMFATQIGTPLSRSNVLRDLRRTLRRAGLPRLTLHGLRHTSATIGLANGINPKVMADRLGHSNVGITLDRYSHVTAGIEAEAVARLALALDG